jgi:ABC-type multidrug transport system fused ATPase/permease subunit
MRPSANSGSLSRLIGLLQPWWGVIFLGGLFVVIAAPCELFPAVVWKFVTDVLVLRKHESHWMVVWFSFGGHITSRVALLVSAVVWLFLVYLLGETLETLEGYLLNRAAEQFILGFRNTVYRKLQSQSLAYLQRQRTGDLMSRAMGDVDEIQSFIVNSIDVIFSEGILWLGTVVFVFITDWRVAAVSLAPLLVVYVLLRIFNKKVKPIYAAARARLGDVSNRLQENLSGVVVIKIFNREEQEAERFRKSTTEYYNQQLKAITARSLFFPFSRVVGFFSNVFMIGSGGYYMITDGSFTVGDLVLFRSYWWRLFGPIQTLARLNDMIQRAIAASNRVFEVLDAPEELPEPADAVAIEKVAGAMELKEVWFTYPTVETSGENGDRPPTLRDINLMIRPGQTVALCGPSGSGKSTILNLLLRFYDPSKGQVLLDGIDIRHLRKDSFRSHFALVQQETFLFNDSLLDNIRYGHAEATMAEVTAAARAANAHDFIMQMPAGYDTKVGERGVRLSGGQKQRISIARAFLSNPAILLLDEPTSSVEPESEALIIAALSRLMKGRTTVLTSHRPSLINAADQIYVIEAGRVTEAGTPGELAAAGGWFQRFSAGDQTGGDQAAGDETKEPRLQATGAFEARN